MGRRMNEILKWYERELGNIHSEIERKNLNAIFMRKIHETAKRPYTFLDFLESLVYSPFDNLKKISQIAHKSWQWIRANVVIKG